MTRDPTLETALEAVSLGALQYLVKPIANDLLLSAVERASKLNRLARAKRDSLGFSEKNPIWPETEPA